MSARPRVLVVGGGLGGLAAAWRLSEPGWQQRFSSITVLERTARLGGKGASGRGPHGRIEEHGLHVWLGYYDSAFRIVRECYAELDRERTDPGCPLRTWRDAFFPSARVGLFDDGPDGWTPWVATFSRNHLLPGEPDPGQAFPPLTEMLTRSALLMRDFASTFRQADLASAVSVSASSAAPPPRARLAASRAAVTDVLLAVAGQLIWLARLGSRRLEGPAGGSAIAAAFEPLLQRLRRRAGSSPGARRLHDLIDIVRTTLVGMAVDGLGNERDAYDAINHLELRDWLRGHGARPETLRSPTVRGQYDLAFAYRDGDPARPEVGAGLAVLLSLRLWLDYKGAFFWKMRAGMGEVVFAPLYQAMTARGVSFRFEHEVTDLEPAPDGQTIDALVVRVPLDPAPFEPLSRVGGLPSFAGPKRTQREQTDQRLLRGNDFDQIVLAVPPAAARGATTRLAAQKPAWRDLVNGMGSVATHAFQLWLRQDDRALGWPDPGSVMAGFADPFDTWASMPHLLPFEDWAAAPPATVAYFCSTMAQVDADSPDPQRRTRDLAVRFLDRHARVFWPNSVDPHTRGFRWDLLVAPDGAEGPERFDAQFWTANVDPSDRYVQALPGTDRLRLPPDGSGYRNLALAGDWTDCGVNAGCIEAAAVSGLQAANALRGDPRWHRIPGLHLQE